MPPTDSHLKADLMLFAVTLLAALGWLFSKEALGGLPPLLFIGTRFLLAGGVLAMLGWRQLAQLNRSQCLQSIGVGALFAIAMGLWVMGLFHTTHVGEGAFIASLGTVLVPVVAAAIFKDRPPLTTWIALPLAVCGFALLSLDRGFQVEPGQWFFLAAAVVFALLFNFTSRVVDTVPAWPLTAIQLVVVGVVLLPVSALLEVWPQEVAGPIWGWLLASAFIATALRFLVQVAAQGMTTPSHAALIMMLEPMWTALLAAFWFAERMTAGQLAGCALIFFALLLNRWNWIRGLIRHYMS